MERFMTLFVTARKPSRLPGCAAFAGLLLAALNALAQPPATGPGVPETLPGPAQGEVQKLREFKEESRRVSEYDRLRSDEMAEKKKQRDALEKEQGALVQPRQLLDHWFELPASLKLSAEGRALAEAALQPHRERVAAAWPAWQEQAVAASTDVPAKRKADRKVDYGQAALQLSARAANEAALWFADAEPDAGDAIWIEALRRGGLCANLANAGPAAQMATLIDALPADQRAAAWTGEAARLARWGQETRTVLPAPERALEDGLVVALAAPNATKTLAGMPEALRASVQSPGWTMASQAPAQRCELLRWWSQEQVRHKRLSPRQAMLAWRTALAPRSKDVLLVGQPRGGAQAIDAGGYPRVARQLGLAGRVVVEQEVDAAGKPLQSFIQRRELHAARLGSQVPLALEHELDQATLERVAAMPLSAPEPASLRDGSATRRVAIEWVMN
jgi:hypothetical protein